MIEVHLLQAVSYFINFIVFFFIVPNVIQESASTSSGGGGGGGSRFGGGGGGLFPGGVPMLPSQMRGRGR